ncbi:MAG: hypothetical protein U1E29_06920 [Coriobacteriia bacterium]|nr:hypothetical protein [Coriobacteriia bacterium]
MQHFREWVHHIVLVGAAVLASLAPRVGLSLLALTSEFGAFTLAVLLGAAIAIAAGVLYGFWAHSQSLARVALTSYGVSLVGSALGQLLSLAWDWREFGGGSFDAVVGLMISNPSLAWFWLLSWPAIIGGCAVVVGRPLGARRARRLQPSWDVAASGERPA